ncbi:SETMR methyltransferase, partial [Acromyrmex charruanus]
MSEIMEQRSAIKFCVRNGISAAETLRMCQKAYGDGALSQARVFAWHRMFKEGRESVQDEPRAGRPSTSTDVIHVQKIRDLVLANRRLTVRDLTDLVGISEGSVKTILSDHLGLRKVKATNLNKLNSLIKRHKDILPREKRKNVAYKISCKSCDSSYVEQTYRNSNNQSVITEHRIEFEHDFDWENVTILDEECFLNKRLISECLHILMQQNNLNLRSDTNSVHQTYIIKRH